MNIGVSTLTARHREAGKRGDSFNTNRFDDVVSSYHSMKNRRDIRDKLNECGKYQLCRPKWNALSRYSENKTWKRSLWDMHEWEKIPAKHDAKARNCETSSSGDDVSGTGYDGGGGSGAVVMLGATRRSRVRV